MVVIYFLCVFAMASTMGSQFPGKGHNLLLNKHIKVAAVPWSPFIIFYCNEEKMDRTDECLDKGNETYGGALWELLKLVKHARNVTYSILKPPTLEWGICYSPNNCTGMIGMVNRREVDFALGKCNICYTMEFITKLIFSGPFTQTLSRAEAVDFTLSIGISTHYTIVVPLRFKDNLLSITDPLSFEVWICFLICIPAYIGVIILMNYIYSGSPNWEATASFVLRSALSERKDRLPPKHLYQKLLVLVWSWMMVVLICAYKADLIAIITKPTMNTPFTNADDMVKQTQIKWGLHDDATLFTSYAKKSSQGTTFRKIFEQRITFPNNDTQTDDCYRSAYQAKNSGNIASICDISSARYLVANEFSKTGTCNYYLTQDKILATGNALAFQVRS